jgi:hypothetical protein
MKRLGLIILTFAAALTLSGCSALDALLQVNILKSLAAVSPDEIKSADSATLLDLSASSSFYETLAGDAATKDAALATIDASIGGSISGATDEELAVLAANIELKTTPAFDLVNNVGSLISDLISGATLPNATTLKDTLLDLLPSSVLGSGGTINEAAFLSMVDGLVAANGYYDALGAAIGADGYASGTDISAGDVAQSALIAAMVASVPKGTYPTTGEYLYALLTGSASAPTSYDFPDMTLGTPLGNLLAAANISF